MSQEISMPTPNKPNYSICINEIEDYFFLFLDVFFGYTISNKSERKNKKELNIDNETYESRLTILSAKRPQL